MFAFTAAKKHRGILRLVGVHPVAESGAEAAGMPFATLVDTSAIIDGRIADIVKTGFLKGELVVPEFVLRELQQVADSGDSLKRDRGRRGLEVVQGLRSDVVVTTPDVDFPELDEVDAKLLKLAKERGLRILTTDFNLNRLARIQDVEVLNVNELANALKPAVLPGEPFDVRVIREGKEHDQGVGYLDDGTMVVVEGGRRLMGETVAVQVTSVLQSPVGQDDLHQGERKTPATNELDLGDRGRRAATAPGSAPTGRRRSSGSAAGCCWRTRSICSRITRRSIGWCWSCPPSGRSRRRSWPTSSPPARWPRRCAGGATRALSVAAGLDEVAADAETILVHDAARPFASAGLIDRLLEALASHAGAVPAMPVTDTVKRVSDGRVAETLDRGELRAVQTPQAFRAEALRRAYAAPAAALRDATDCASLVEAAGLDVAVVPGEAGEHEDHHARRPRPRRGRLR